MQRNDHHHPSIVQDLPNTCTCHPFHENNLILNTDPEQAIKSEKDISNVRGRLPCNDIPIVYPPIVHLNNFEKIMHNNQHWAAETLKHRPHFFQKLTEGQHPEYLWIGCSDSRVPANEIIGLEAGELFVHRNVANMAPLSDINAQAVIQFAVGVLKVKDIIVCGHYGCGGIKAAFRKEDFGALETWLSYIRSLKAKYRKQFTSEHQADNQALLVELNVMHNVENVSRMPVVQKAWKQGAQLRVHGLVYRLQDGILKNLQITIDSLDKLQEEFRIY